jgi:hypothetical protein
MPSEADAPSQTREGCGEVVTRQQAMFLGWNDAAWGRPRRVSPVGRTKWYEVGYAGGLAFRRARRHQSAVRDDDS